MPGPLDGVKVLDLTSIYSGPICASILGDHGADVIKIEAPEGDTMRAGARYSRHGVSGPFAVMNRNKRAMVLDLRTDAGKDVLRRMLSQADVVVENYRPGVMERLGFGWEQLQEINERLIYASINGVGSVGPYAKRRVYDAVIQAISGVASLQADPSVEKPQMINTLLCDKVTAITAAQNISSALYAREQNWTRSVRPKFPCLILRCFFMWAGQHGETSHLLVRETPPRSYGSHSYFVRENKRRLHCHNAGQTRRVARTIRCIGAFKPSPR